MVNLHNHTQFSALDGLIKIGELLDAAKEQKAVAITDHGEMAGVIDFLVSSIDREVKPIVGCEFYFSERRDATKKNEKNTHLVLLAENEIGYKNLIKLATEAYTTGLQSKPRIDWELLEKHNQGTILTTACLGGLLPQSILGKSPLPAEKVIQRYLELFEGRMWLEIIPFNVEEQKLVNKELLNISKKYGIPIMVSGDTHYLKREDAKIHDLLLAIQTKKRFDDPKRFRFDTYDFFFRDENDFYEDLLYLPKEQIAEGLNQTIEIADRIEDLRRIVKRFDLLEFPIPEDREFDKWLKGEKASKENYLVFLCDKGFRSKLSGIDDYSPYLERFKKEMAIIKEREFIDYFLIVQDYVKWAKANNILVGPARGSAAGSLIAYLLDITDVDPIKYGLYFERFISPGRKELPDIDIDFEHEKKGEVHEYLKTKYGNERVIQIATYTKMDKRQTIRDVARALGVDAKKSDKLIDVILKNLPEEVSLKEAFSNQFIRDSIKREIGAFLGKDTDFFFEAVTKLEGTIRQYGRHAAGVILSNSPIVDICPLRKISGHITTQSDMHDLEKLGLLKVDILGLKALTTMKRTMELIGKEISWSDKDYEDRETWRAICEDSCLGLFQIETPGIDNLIKTIKPQSIKELAILIALYRPGPLRSGLAEEYLNVVTKSIPFSPPFEEMKEILADTHGIMVFQEQVLEIVQRIAGYSSEEADNLRKIIGKKLQEKLEEEEKFFKSKCLERGHSTEKTNLLWDNLVEYGGYTFNLSHAISYAILAFRTAWLKHYYPLEYMCALLNTETEKQSLYIEECHSQGIGILPPDINRSDFGFTIEDGKLRFGLGNIKTLGEATIKDIIDNRPYSSPSEYLEKTSIAKHKNSMEALILSGAFDCFFPNIPRKDILLSYYEKRGEKDCPIKDFNAEELERVFFGAYIENKRKAKYQLLEQTDQVKSKAVWETIPNNYDVWISGIVWETKNYLNGRYYGGNGYLFPLWGNPIYFQSRFRPENLEGKTVSLKLKKTKSGIIAEEAKEIV